MVKFRNLFLGSLLLWQHDSCHCSFFDCASSGLYNSRRFIDYRSVKQIEVRDVTSPHDKESQTIVFAVISWSMWHFRWNACWICDVILTRTQPMQQRVLLAAEPALISLWLLRCEVLNITTESQSSSELLQNSSLNHTLKYLCPVKLWNMSLWDFNRIIYINILWREQS